MLQRRPRVLFLFVAALLAGCRLSPSPFTCTDAIGCVEIAPGDPIKIGVVQTLVDRQIEPLPTPRSGGLK